MFVVVLAGGRCRRHHHGVARAGEAERLEPVVHQRDHLVGVGRRRGGERLDAPLQHMIRWTSRGGMNA